MLHSKQSGRSREATCVNIARDHVSDKKDFSNGEGTHGKDAMLFQISLSSRDAYKGRKKGGAPKAQLYIPFPSFQASRARIAHV
jgi:hypothetical protein